MKDIIAKVTISFLLLTSIGLISGCAGNQNQFADNNDDANIVKVHTSKSIDQSIANQAKEKVIKEEEILGVKAVNTDKELLIAVEVNHMDRFRLKEIEKKINQKTEKQFPNHEVTISTDSKIFLELEKLENKMKKNKLDNKKLEKELKRIKSLSEELT
jgi:Sporulation lipoprotein YhcN/YlaJ (Spore_YhcN_YlaJ)